MRRIAGLCAGVGFAILTGCLPQQTSRPQIADDATDAESFSTIGSKTAIGNVDPIPVSGVGLVHNLRGTGSAPQPDAYRTMLEQAIRRNKANPKEFFDDPEKRFSLVLISTVIPPGARAGDRLDAAISLPPSSRTTSLQNGILYQTDLSNFEIAGAAREAMQSSGIPVGATPSANEGTLLTGNRMATAEGILSPGHSGEVKTDVDGVIEGPKAARIWDGVKNQTDRPYYFLLNENSPQPRLAMVIAERLNAVFPAPGEKLQKLADAKVQGKPLVISYVPPTYRHNHTRYLLVARQVPLTPVTSDSPYRAQLKDDLLRPETALTAAIKLEALGGDSRQAFRIGLESDSPWVRFACAESLAYLGHSDGVKTLAELAEKHPAFRAQCLTALGSLDDAISLDSLAELMRKPDAQLRYGAFVALRTADPRHDAVRGKTLNSSFFVHHTAPDSQPMIHVNTERRNEIVLFGSQFAMRTPFSFPLGKDFIVSAKDGEPTATIRRIVKDKNGEPTTVEKQCRTDVAQIVQILGESGASYAETVEFLRRAEKADLLTSALMFDNAPRGLNITQLAAISRNDRDLTKADLEVARSGTTGVVQAGYDLPSEADAIKTEPKPDLAPALNRSPGRVFGSR
ncbi:MAG: HEAT repeat domain-containing protein [Fimbriiglobus sp.]